MSLYEDGRQSPANALFLPGVGLIAVGAVTLFMVAAISGYRVVRAPHER